MRILFFIMLACFTFSTFAQDTRDEEWQSVIESREASAENPSLQNEEIILLFDEKININKADESDFKKLLFLNDLEISAIVSYRNIIGDFIDGYELQSVPYLSLSKARQLNKFIILSKEKKGNEIKSSLSHGEHHLLISTNLPVQIAEGFYSNDSVNYNHYEGSPQSLLLKYDYKYKNKLSYGLLAEKDAGESFFRKSNPNGFDFYSAHLFIRDFKFFKTIAIGDFNVNIAQGLILWQSFAFGKGADVLQIKRQGEILKPYHSSNENNFMRGVGTTFKLRQIEVTCFASSFKKDANGIEDTLDGTIKYISSNQISGNHRTSSEIADEKLQRQTAYGLRVLLKKNNYSLGLNAVHYRYSLNKIKDELPYHLFDFNNDKLTDISFDYATTFKNVHMFGEFALSDNYALAFVNGALVSINKNVDLSFLYRNLSPKYQSLNSNAFSENYSSSNELGLYTGVSLKPWSGLQINIYTDLFRFPWLKYAVNAPSDGVEYSLIINYDINKKTKLSFSYKSKTKNQNEIMDDDFQIKTLSPHQKNDIRFQINQSLNDKISLVNRLEITKYKINDIESSNGFLFYTDLKFRNIFKKSSAEFRVLFFDISAYDSRIYAYENDLTQSFSIPGYSGKGFKSFVTFKMPISPKLTFHGKYSAIFYCDKDHIGEFLDQIKGDKYAEFKFQMVYNF